MHCSSMLRCLLLAAEAMRLLNIPSLLTRQVRHSRRCSLISMAIFLTMLMATTSHGQYVQICLSLHRSNTVLYQLQRRRKSWISVLRSFLLQRASVLSLQSLGVTILSMLEDRCSVMQPIIRAQYGLGSLVSISRHASRCTSVLVSLGLTAAS